MESYLHLNNSKQDAISLIKSLKQRTRMYVPHMYYYNLVAFIDGYSQRNRELSGFNLSVEFDNWYFNIKVRRQCSSGWEHHIYNELANKNEAVAIKITFELLDEFIEFLDT